jgi:hypothetical protein
MKKLFLPYELAVIAKEKGFDESCLGEYLKFREPKEIIFTNPTNKLYATSNSILAPLYQQIIDWFREKYKIHIQIERVSDQNLLYYKCFLNINGHNSYAIESKNNPSHSMFAYPDYYSAMNAAITEAFKLI